MVKGIGTVILTWPSGALHCWQTEQDSVSPLQRECRWAGTIRKKKEHSNIQSYLEHSLTITEIKKIQISYKQSLLCWCNLHQTRQTYKVFHITALHILNTALHIPNMLSVGYKITDKNVTN